MSPAIEAEDEDYDSAADSDFAASDAPSTGEDSDENEDDGRGLATSSRAGGTSRKRDADGDLEMGSGDEGIVAQGRKKRRKNKKGGKGKSKGADGVPADGEQDEDDDDEDAGSVGIRVRLRSGRGGEDAKRSSARKHAAPTADIDEIWARMNIPSARRAPEPPAPAPVTSGDVDSQPVKDVEQGPGDQITKPIGEATSHEKDQTITIPHTYTFAGQIHTSTKTVPISSAAAQAYLAEQKTGERQQSSKDAPEKPAPGPQLRRPLARRNLLEPNPTHFIDATGVTLPPRTDLPFSIGGSRLAPLASVDKENVPSSQIVKTARAKLERGEKLNTVEKSKLDWEAEVERLGIREELQKAEKSGTSYLGRRDFLDRVEGREEDERRKARLGTSAAATTMGLS